VKATISMPKTAALKIREVRKVLVEAELAELMLDLKQSQKEKEKERERIHSVGLWTWKERKKI
jgi:hypothetical protein